MEGVNNIAQYLINVMETSYGFIELEAESAEDAQDKAEKEYHNGNTIWGKLEFTIQEIKKEDNKE